MFVIKDTLIESAASNGNLRLVKYLFPLVLDENSREKSLRSSSKNGHLDVVKYSFPLVLDEESR